MNKAKPQRYENIDALRAIAALLVVIQHFFGDIVREAQNQQTPLIELIQYSLNSIDLGRFGVILFFLISGFVVPFSIRGAHPLRRFAISRFFRLYPALWLAVITLSIFFVYKGSAPSIATILANMTMFPSFLGFHWLSGIYWTLTIELVFYFLCAALFWKNALYAPKIVTAFALLLICSTALPILMRMHVGINLPVQYIGLHVSFLYCGLLFRLAMIDKKAGAWTGAIIVTIALFSVLFTIGDFSLERGDSFFLIGKLPIIVAYILAFIIFISAVYSGKPQSSLLSFGGSISYSIYLFHGIAALLVYQFLALTGNWTDLLTGLVSLSLTILISHSVYKYLETPMIALGRKITSRNEPRATIAAPQS